MAGNSISHHVSQPPMIWKHHWDAIQQMCCMSSNDEAPVHTLGASALAYGTVVDTSSRTKTVGGTYEAIANGDMLVLPQLYNSPQGRQSLRFRALLACMLSPQTKDAQTARAFRNIEDLVLSSAAQMMKSGSQGNSLITAAAAPQPVLTAAAVLALPLADVERAISPVNFYRTKAKNVHLACKRIVDSAYMTTYVDEAGRAHEELAGIPVDLPDLLTFSGVGPKIAYLTFSIAWGRHEGICVDTHVHRIANRLRWVGVGTGDAPISKAGGGRSGKTGHLSEINLDGESNKDLERGSGASRVLMKNTASAEQSRRQLQSLLPRELWGEVNGLLVQFGQTVCSAKSPKCHRCSLSDVCDWSLSRGTNE